MRGNHRIIHWMLWAALSALPAAGCSDDDDDAPPADDDDDVSEDCLDGQSEEEAGCRCTPAQHALQGRCYDFCPAGQILDGEACGTSGVVFGWSRDIRQSANPFPDDRYRTSEGKYSPPEWAFLEFPDPSEFTEGSGAADFGDALIDSIEINAGGWGIFSPVELSLSGPVDTATLPGGTLVFNLDTLEEWNFGFAPTWNDAIGVLDLQPEMPFDSDTTYGVILTSAVRSEDGNPLGRSDDFRELLLDGDAGDMGVLLQQALSALQLNPDAVAGAFTFHTDRTWQDLVAIRDRLDAGDLAPPLPRFDDAPATEYEEGIFLGEDPRLTAMLEEGAPFFQLAAVGRAALYDFRDGDGIYDPAQVADGGQPGTNTVRFTLAISDQPMPPDGYPIVILGHGLGMSADFTADIATFAPNFPTMPPLAFLAHDFPNHGARGSGNELTDLLGYFAGLTNFYAMRDSFRQTVCELVQIRRMIQAAHDGGIAPFDLIDPDRILYAGASLGGINGATFLAVDSSVRTGMLSVPAGELVRILEGREIGAFITPVLGTLIGLDPRDPDYPINAAHFFRLLINRGLWIMAAGDSISYAPFVVREQAQLPGATRKSVLIQMGLGDNVLPNNTTLDLARVMGVPTVEEETVCTDPDCGVSGMWIYDPADYGYDGEPHQISAEIVQAQRQIIEYLATEGRHITNANP